MLDFLKGKRKGNCIGSPCKGKAVALTEVPDPTFSEKILGDGFAVIPSEGKIYAPADGEVTVVFDTPDRRILPSAVEWNVMRLINSWIYCLLLWIGNYILPKITVKTVL